ncbi:hypothetical protein EDC62_1322 [Tibeticola sediminis]|uniref:PepSY domain-containing protein n=1 Tax=Tibeticola sediminis TaxID=1917811 RepID=A0A3N4UJS3_9BURK|nr:PepSY domain-containing protein [Tibeticola sediminis]RPE70832.1 hypothetical protein EDC62_1322 [Tibeticola sediminis]
MTIKVRWLGILVGCVGCVSFGPVWAGSAAEDVVCTQAPRSAWISEAQARAKFGAEKFTLVKFKISRGNCYEFYAIAKDGTAVEAYYDPVSGEPVIYNRVALDRTGDTRYESQRARR